MTTRQTINTTVWNTEAGESDWPIDEEPGSLGRFIRALEEKLSIIPIEHRHTALIKLSATRYYEEDSYPNIEISYDRLETDEEFEARVSQYRSEQAVIKARKEAEERYLLETLKTKYEPKGE